MYNTIYYIIFFSVVVLLTHIDMYSKTYFQTVIEVVEPCEINRGPPVTTMTIVVTCNRAGAWEPFICSHCLTRFVKRGQNTTTSANAPSPPPPPHSWQANRRSTRSHQMCPNTMVCESSYGQFRGVSDLRISA
jgi:hypothetical protein